MSTVDQHKIYKKIKAKTEIAIINSDKTVGSYIYDTLLKNPNQKIKGKLVRTIERNFYKAELEAILKKQKEEHLELRNTELYETCLQELYEFNDAHKESIATKDFIHLFLNDIIFYQRPLKSKKSQISNCPFEVRPMKDKQGNLLQDENGQTVKRSLKCIAKSHPLFQEFRLWQFLQNLRIYEKEKIIDGKAYSDVNVTEQFLNGDQDKAKLFDWLNDQKEINQDAFLKYFKLKSDKFRWNYVEDKETKYPCNETRSVILSRLKKIENIDADFLSKTIEEALWHILYSVEDREDIAKALASFAAKHGLGDDFVLHFKKFPPFKKEYGAYSAKAIKKLLSLIRMGNYWSEDNIDQKTKERIDKIIDGEVDEKIQERVREKVSLLKNLNEFKGLPLWLASYVVYNRHSEDGKATKWKTAADITLLTQHSLRNPIVEQVINETLQVVRDIWKHHGKGTENFFDEIHIELGRDMKNPADRRKQMSKQNNENENTNLRIKALLVELFNDQVENVRPYSPSQQEILKIYEDGVLKSDIEISEEILSISKKAQPSSSEISRYKLWLEQQYRSPYTGAIIPLSKLFTPAYQIEHIIPQSRFFDDSFSNKVICEAEVNKDKDNLTGYEYISKHSGKKIELSNRKEISLFTIIQYEEFVKKHYNNNRSKKNKLLMEDIPEAFVQRQLNDSRYISKVVKSLLSNIVRQEDEQESTSKNVIASNGGITSILKQNWGLNDVWNEIITPRFQRLNDLTKSSNFGQNTNKDGKKIFHVQVPLELQKGFNKKRIDHRHHALDAIVIACASRNHIAYLHNESALGKKTKEQKENVRYDLKHKLCFKKYNDDAKQNYKWIFHKPWVNFTQDASSALNEIVVSFKKNNRVINKTSNLYQIWKKDGNGKPIEKEFVRQSKGETWAIRKSMHKATVSGIVQLRQIKEQVQLSAAIDKYEMIVDKVIKAEVKKLIEQNTDTKKIQKYLKDKGISKIDIYHFSENVASRVKIDESFDSKKIKSITDSGIQKIMIAHLFTFNENIDGKTVEHPELAFSSDGIDELNKNIFSLNGNKFHQAIYKVRTFEPKGNKFNIGSTGNKKDKFVEADGGTNLFFAIYADAQNNRSYASTPLNVVIENQKQGAIENKKPEFCSVPERNEIGDSLLFHLSPNDLVYVPTDEERLNMNLVNFLRLTKDQIQRIYKFTDSSGTTANFIPYYIADIIFNVSKKEQIKLQMNYPIQNEFGIGSPQSKNQRALDGTMIKEFCLKLQIDRIGGLKRALK